MIQSAIAGNEVLAVSVSRQPIFLALGIALMLLITAIDYHYWGSLARFMYIFALVSLLIIYVYGQARYGSARWFDTGVDPNSAIRDSKNNHDHGSGGLFCQKSG